MSHTLEANFKFADKMGYAPLNMGNYIQLVKVLDYGEQAIKDFNSRKIAKLKPIKKKSRYLRGTK